MKSLMTFPRGSQLLWRFHLLLVITTFVFSLSGCNIFEEDEPLRDTRLRVRKNVMDLSARERAEFIDAILLLKATPSPFSDTLTYYDQFVAFHQMAVVQSRKQQYGVAHHNPAFPPWHRKLLLLYEEALREVSGYNIALPYWDWTDPRSTAAVFTDDFMGPGGVKEQGYAVLTGPFRKDVWQLNLLPSNPAQRKQSPHRYLVRGIGDDSGNNYPIILPTAPQVERCLSVSRYDADPWNMNVPRNSSFRNFLEGFDPAQPDNQFMHNIVHDWVAGIFVYQGDTLIGSMEPLDVSPNDPVFFLHHCNVDRIFAQWETRYPNETYQPQSGAPEGMNVNDRMYPYSLWENDQLMTGRHGITPGDMFGTRNLGYVYRE